MAVNESLEKKIGKILENLAMGWYLNGRYDVIHQITSGESPKHPESIMKLKADEATQAIDEILKAQREAIRERLPVKVTREIAALEFGWMDEEAVAYNSVIDQITKVLNELEGGEL